MRKTAYALVSVLSLFAALSLPVPVFGIGPDGQTSSADGPALDPDTVAVAQVNMSIRELGEPQEIAVLHDYDESPRFALAVSQAGYLIMDIPSGLVLEWSEAQDPYAGYGDAVKYYGGFGLYLVRQEGAFLDIRQQTPVESLPHLSTVDEAELEEAYVQGFQPIGPEGSFMPLAATSLKTLPYAYDYIQKLSFGNNTYDTCTAVATGLALNYLDRSLDDAIVPTRWEAEPLRETTPATTSWDTSYTRTEALYDYLLYVGLDPSIWGICHSGLSRIVLQSLSVSIASM